MCKQRVLLLVPEERSRRRTLFDSDDTYIAFRTEFQARVKPMLDAQNLARTESEQEAMGHVIPC